MKVLGWLCSRAQLNLCHQPTHNRLGGKRVSVSIWKNHNCSSSAQLWRKGWFSHEKHISEFTSLPESLNLKNQFTIFSLKTELFCSLFKLKWKKSTKYWLPPCFICCNSLILQIYTSALNSRNKHRTMVLTRHAACPSQIGSNWISRPKCHLHPFSTEAFNW